MVSLCRYKYNWRSILLFLCALIISFKSFGVEITTGNLLPNSGNGRDWNSTSTDSFVLLDALDAGTQPDLDLELTHQLRDNLELSLGTAWDLNKQAREEITLGVSFSF